MSHAGGCHCGNVRYELATTLGLEALPRRACQCSFCRRHGALSTSDPEGAVTFRVRDPVQLTRYRFGSNTADFLICARCGVYVGATLEEAGRRWAVINANTLDDAAGLTQPVANFDYDGETAARRMARRKARWTPVAPE